MHYHNHKINNNKGNGSNGNGHEKGPCGGIKNGKTLRFGISANSRLLENFDMMISEKGYINRSEAIRDIIRDELVEYAWTKNNEEIVGTITIVYNHEAKELIEKLMTLQHMDYGKVISSLHVHLDGHHCLEVLVVKGESGKIKGLSDRLIGTKGVKHGKLTMSTTGNNLD